MSAPLPEGEAERLVSLQAHNILDTPPEEGFDDLVRLAAHVCGVPIAAVSLIDADRQWFKSIIGLGIKETPRDAAFCAHTILQPDLLVVQDAQADPRFADNPLVTGEPNIRFYAGMPLISEEGRALGSLCVIDRTPRGLTPEQQMALRLLARQVSTHLGAARRLAERERLVAEEEQAEVRRAASEAERERLAAIVESSSDAIWSADMDCRITTWNAGAERIYGYAACDVVGRHQSVLLPPGEGGFLAVIIDALRRGEDRHNLEVRRRRKDGAEIDLSLTFSPIRDATGVMVGLACTARDITGQKWAEAALHKEREFTRALLESMQEGIIACDADGTLTLVNRAGRELHDLPEKALPSERWTEHFDLYAADGVTPMRTQDIPLFRALQGEDVDDAEVLVAPRSGPARVLLVSGRPIHGANGRKLGAVTAMRDVTERRQTERELARLAAIVESSDEAIVATMLDGTVVSWNKGAESLYGYAAAEVVGRDFSVLADPGGPSPVPAVVTRLVRGEAVDSVEVARVRRDGTVFHAALSFSPIRDAAGNMVGLSCTARDVTARKRAEDALAETNARLAESEERLRRLTDAAFEGICVSQGGVIVDASPAFAALFGYAAPAQVVGLAAGLLAAPESRRLLLEKLASSEEEAYEATLLRQNGAPFQAEMRGRVIRIGGRPARVTAVRDVTERRALEAEMRAGERRLAEAQRIAHIGNWEYDFATGGFKWSQEMFHLFEMNPADGEPSVETLLGRYHPDDVPAYSALVQQAIQDNLPHEFDIRILRRDGSARWAHAAGRDERDGAGRVVRLFGTLMDIHERKTMEEAQRESAEHLRRSEARLIEAQRLARIGDWELDVATRRFTWSAEVFRLLEFDPAQGEPGYEAIMARYQPDDRAERDRLFAQALADGIPYQCDLRLRLPSETPRWCHLVGRPVLDATGTVSRVTGTVMDVTERVVSEERFRVLFERSSDAHLLCGEGGIIDCNGATLGLLGYADKAQILALHPAILSPEFQPDGRRSAEKGLAMEAVAREHGSHRFEWIHRRMNGEEFPVEVTLTPITLADGPVMLAVLHDLTDRKRAEEAVRDHAVVLEFQKGQLEAANRELEALAATDGLTGLTNHRAFHERLAAEVRRAERYGTPLALVFLDVDHFKSYNDSYGHPAGDDVLRRIADLLRQNARETDLIARYGGEEFVIVLPQTDGGAARTLAERIRAAVEAAPWPHCPITASLGIAALRPGVESGGDLIARADQALYQAKKGGRNRVAPAPLARRKVSGAREAPCPG